MPKCRKKKKKKKSKAGLPAPRRYLREGKKKKAAHSFIRLLFPISTTSIRFKKGKGSELFQIREGKEEKAPLILWYPAS